MDRRGIYADICGRVRDRCSLLLRIAPVPLPAIAPPKLTRAGSSDGGLVHSRCVEFVCMLQRVAVLVHSNIQ